MTGCKIDHLSSPYAQMKTCYEGDCEFFFDEGAGFFSIFATNSCDRAVPSHAGDNDSKCRSPLDSNFWNSKRPGHEGLTEEEQEDVCRSQPVGLDTTGTYGVGGQVAKGGYCEYRAKIEPDSVFPHGREAECVYNPEMVSCIDLSGAECRSVSRYNCHWSADAGCLPAVWGCTDENALNYSSVATVDDGSCQLQGQAQGESFFEQGESLSFSGRQ